VRNITALESVKATSVGVVQAQYYAIFHNRANLFFYLLYADFADGLRFTQINGAVFKPGLRVGHASPFLADAGSSVFQTVPIRRPLQKEARADQTRARLTRGLPASASSPLQGSLALL
jgi:hypothetical protein